MSIEIGPSTFKTISRRTKHYGICCIQRHCRTGPHKRCIAFPPVSAKTLSFYGQEGCILLVTAGDAKVDNSKFKHTFGHKPKMLAAEDVPAMTNHAIGGVCPFGVPETAAIYLDTSLQRFTTVFPACGSSNSAIELDCDTLFQYAGAKAWVDVCKGWQEACQA